MSHAPRAAAAVALAAALTAGGCRTPPPAPDQRPAPISHIVLIKLRNSADASALITDSDRLIPSIPAVTSYACGRHLDTGRASVDGSYDVGLYVGFADEGGYRTYVDHPNHVELVTTWRPRWESIRIYDVADRTP